jgi:hypothetical protein
LSKKTRKFEKMENIDNQGNVNYQGELNVYFEIYAQSCHFIAISDGNLKIYNTLNHKELYQRLTRYRFVHIKAV